MITVLFSGGIDSWGCLLVAIQDFGLENVQPLYVDFGQKYASKEYGVVKDLCCRLGILHNLVVRDMRGLLTENSTDGHIPLRNTLLLMAAAADERSEGVMLGMLKGESCEDKNPKYISLMQKLFDSQFESSIYRKTSRDFYIYTPFADYTKTQLMQWCLENGPRYGVDSTVACFKGTALPCGNCISCFNRWVARRLNNLPDEEYDDMRCGYAPFYWMLSAILNLDRAKKANAQLFSLTQIWLKRHWITDSYRAMSQVSKRFEKVGLLRYILQTKRELSNGTY